VRVLLVNKFFHPRAGAETAFFQTRSLLYARGHEVVDFAMRHPDNLPSPYARFFAPERDYTAAAPAGRRVVDAASSVYSVSARRALAKLLDEVTPDVAHLHNVYHQLTLSVVDELAQRGIPIVLTLHDWKVACPAYTLFLDGEPCRRCPSGTVMNAVRHRCIKGSTLASALGAAEALVAQRRHSYGRVQRFIAPSRFAISVAEMGGIDPARVRHIPNFLPEAEIQEPDAAGDAPRVLYAGRLEDTKGIRVLLDAFERVREPVNLRIAGQGPLEGEIRAAASRDTRISFLGMLPREGVYAEIDQARAIVLPSLYEDNGPMIILEAQARGRAMVVSDRGGLPEFVRHDETGIIVRAGDPEALALAITRLGGDAALAQRLGNGAHEVVREEHSASRHYGRLMETYQDAIREMAGQ
jgi:glycosyltransferase involved in cell wall biosynthesis